MEVHNFQDLIVWQKAHILVLEIYKLSKDFPDEEKFCLSYQIRRSSASICANVAESYRKSRKDFLRFIDIAQGSLEETIYHLILSRDLGYCLKSDYTHLLDLSDEIGKMLSGLKRSLL